MPGGRQIRLDRSSTARGGTDLIKPTDAGSCSPSPHSPSTYTLENMSLSFCCTTGVIVSVALLHPSSVIASSPPPLPRAPKTVQGYPRRQHRRSRWSSHLYVLVLDRVPVPCSRCSKSALTRLCGLQTSPSPPATTTRPRRFCSFPTSSASSSPSESCTCASCTAATCVQWSVQGADKLCAPQRKGMAPLQPV